MNEEKQKNVFDMTSGIPLKLIVTFSFPMLMGNLLQQIYNITDSYIVGNYTQNKVQSLAAVSVSAQIILAMTAMLVGLIQGAAIVISQIFGAEKDSPRENERIKSAVDTIYISLVAFTIPFTVAGVLAVRPVLTAMNVTGKTLEYATIYLIIIIIGLISYYGYTLNSSILQGLGNSKTAFVFLGVFTVLNIILDVLFVPVLKWGIAGVALATVISQSVSFGFSIFYINKKNYGFKISLKNLRFDKNILKAIIKTGLPTSVQETVFSFGMLFVQRLINNQGDSFMAAYGVAQKIDRFAFMPLITYGMALMTFTGQNIGAREFERIKKGVKSSFFLMLGTFAAICLIILPFGKNLISLFNDDKDVIKYGSEYLARILPIIFIPGTNLLLSGALRGMGKSIVPFIGSEAGLWLGRIPFSRLILFVWSPDIPSNIYHCFTIAWTMEVCVNLFYYLRWTRRKDGGVPVINKV